MKVFDDYLSLIKNDEEEVLEGKYYARRPVLPADVGLEFSYDIVNESDRTYAKLLDNLQTETSLLTIKTNDAKGFKVKGYIVTQDERLWQIQGIIVKRMTENRQALRILKETNETEYVLRLTEVANPWGLK